MPFVSRMELSLPLTKFSIHQAKVPIQQVIPVYLAQVVQEIIPVEAMLHFIIVLGVIPILIRLAAITVPPLVVVALSEIASVQLALRVRLLSPRHSLVDIIIDTGN